MSCTKTTAGVSPDRHVGGIGVVRARAMPVPVRGSRRGGGLSAAIGNQYESRCCRQRRKWQHARATRTAIVYDLSVGLGAREGIDVPEVPRRAAKESIARARRAES